MIGFSNTARGSCLGLLIDAVLVGAVSAHAVKSAHVIATASMLRCAGMSSGVPFGEGVARYAKATGHNVARQPVAGNTGRTLITDLRASG